MGGEGDVKVEGREGEERPYFSQGRALHTANARFSVSLITAANCGQSLTRPRLRSTKTE